MVGGTTPTLEANVVTRTVVWDSHLLYLFINVEIAPGGWCRVGLRDPETNKTLPGFAPEDSSLTALRPSEGGSAATSAGCVVHGFDSTKALVSWKTDASLRGVAGRPVQLVFDIEGASLYSFWVSDSRERGTSRGFLGASGRDTLVKTDDSDGCWVVHAGFDIRCNRDIANMTTTPTLEACKALAIRNNRSVFSWKSEAGSTQHCYTVDCERATGVPNPLTTSGCVTSLPGCVGTPPAAGPAPAPPQHACGPEPPASYEQFGLSVKVLRSEQVIFGFSETLGAGGGYVTGFANGELQTVIRFGPHPPYTSPNRTSRAKRSGDGGQSWVLQPWSQTTNRSVTTFGQNSFELASGEVITFTGFDGHDLCSSKASFTPVPDPQRPGFSITKVELARSADYGKTQTIEVVDIAMPSSFKIGALSHASIVAVEQGKRLVALAYGYNQPMDGLRTRAFVLRSTDARGSAWEFLSTVAFTPEGTVDTRPACASDPATRYNPAPCGQTCVASPWLPHCPPMHYSGFNEGTLVKTAEDAKTGLSTLVCIMRTGGAMYRAISVDSGLTWAAPDPISRYGVAPQAVVMHDPQGKSDGIMAVVYGRPFNFITFSLDGGISFLPEWCFFKSEAKPYDGSDYDTVVQLTNSTTLLLVYGNSRSAYSSEVLGTYISVERSKPG